MAKKKKEQYKITWKKFWGHLHVVNKHRRKVFVLCCKAGIPWRGFVHDLSKYSPIEFFEGVRYFSKTYSPIKECKEVNGYSEAWLHHKGRNKHHFEYWYDYNAPLETPIIPYKYVVEMICDSLAAGMIYKGKKWNKRYQLDYWMKTREKSKVNPKLDFLLTKVYTDVSLNGLDKTINKENLTYLYKKYMG